MPRWISLPVLTLLTLGVTSCATDDPDTGRPRESSIPWNRPASWEGPGVYGGAMNQR